MISFFDVLISLEHPPCFLKFSLLFNLIFPIIRLCSEDCLLFNLLNLFTRLSVEVVFFLLMLSYRTSFILSIYFLKIFSKNCNYQLISNLIVIFTFIFLVPHGSAPKPNRVVTYCITDCVLVLSGIFQKTFHQVPLHVVPFPTLLR